MDTDAYFQVMDAYKKWWRKQRTLKTPLQTKHVKCSSSLQAFFLELLLDIASKQRSIIIIIVIHFWKKCTRQTNILTCLVCSGVSLKVAALDNFLCFLSEYDNFMHEVVHDDTPKISIIAILSRSCPNSNHNLLCNQWSQIKTVLSVAMAMCLLVISLKTCRFSSILYLSIQLATFNVFLPDLQ